MRSGPLGLLYCRIAVVLGNFGSPSVVREQGLIQCARSNQSSLKDGRDEFFSDGRVWFREGKEVDCEEAPKTRVYADSTASDSVLLLV